MTIGAEQKKSAEAAGVSANRSGIPKDNNPWTSQPGFPELKEAWDTGWQRSCDQQSAGSTFGQGNRPYEM